VSQTSGATRRLWDTKAPPTSALRDYGLASQARDTDGDGAPIFTPEFPKADPYHFSEIEEGGHCFFEIGFCSTK
jgi:hypothetical protein